MILKICSKSFFAIFSVREIKKILRNNLSGLDASKQLKDVSFTLQRVFLGLAVVYYSEHLFRSLSRSCDRPGIFLHCARGNAVALPGTRDARATRSWSVLLRSPLPSFRRCAEDESAGSAPRLGALRPGGRAPFPYVPALSSRRN